jgi:hypothetical protein
MATSSIDVPADWRDQLNIREQIARIDRTQAELGKLLAEQPKLRAEARKFRFDPYLIVAGMVVAGIVARLPELLRAFGWAVQ